MNKSIKDGLIFGLVGLMAGGAVGVILASAFVVIQQGGKFNQVQGSESLNYAPWVVGGFQEPFQTGLMIIAAAALIGMVGFIGISYRPHLTSHG